ncbi:MAG: methyltransferase domain-containing protein [Candidatus Moranbacteria bacterium]|nr:methyltransferase domain-containing protein [Candidatus Moranbacteria bacterium]
MSEKLDIAEVKKHLEQYLIGEPVFIKSRSRLRYKWNEKKKHASVGLLEEFIIEEQKESDLSAHCFFCGDKLPMKIDFLYASKQTDGKKIPNFRERMTCPKCGLNNRLRATYHLMRELFPDFEERKIYVTEEATPFFTKLKEKNKNIIGSEYFAGDARKKILIEGLNREVNNEDITKLSFNNGEFDLVISCEVLEHIPDYKKALEEIYRVLKKDGYFIFSVPFISSSKKTITRAKIVDGKTEHILPAEYHGDPVNADGGCLCFYYFGWDLFKELKKTGFQESGIYAYNSPKHAYLGEGLILFAKK